ncbi:MAG: heme o synthase [Fimbriimonadaceae bacterium]|nr:heme o synthase [Fimbriimonadaceae bacterium]
MSADTRSEPDPRGARSWRNGAWVALILCIPVILGGAFVRASLSGDGCGIHWPDCHGTLLPTDAPLKTWIEFSHRASSGLFLLLIAGLWIWSTRIFPKGARPRRAMHAALIFTIISALIGAMLVRNSWVVFDRSAARAITMPLHLINNYVTVSALILALLPASIQPVWKGRGGPGIAVWSSIVGMFLLGATGAISAMGKTAFERELSAAGGFLERLNLHIGESAPLLLRGGVVHPFLAVSVMVLVLFSCRILAERFPSPEVNRWVNWTTGLFVFQMAFGLLNLVASAPIWMQLGHLALALAVWMSFTLAAVHAFSQPIPVSAVEAETVEPGGERPRSPIMAIVADYVALTKPRVISLLLFTTLASMVIAQGGWPNLWQMLAVAIGGYMMAGAANTFNMMVERDLDVAMERTSHRPTVGGRISVRQAGVFAAAMTIGSFALLTASANLLTAALAFAGLLFYVFIYTLLLKRRTWQNIVIGGAAGAFPPLVGYAAVEGRLSLFAWLLFAIIFFWTPVHFWALAILIKDDYAKAGVPMLPVVKGDHATVVQIVVYAGLTTLISILPLFQRELGMVYLGASVILNLGLLVQSIRLMRDTTRDHARVLFKYSMVYLALLFVVIAVDRTLSGGGPI